jgi:hypothetical protein
MPTWPQIALDSGYTSLVLAGAVLLAGHLAGSRDHRYGMSEIARTLPAAPRTRTVGLLAVLPAVAVVAAVTVGLHVLSLLGDRVVGRLDGWDVLAAVAVPVVGTSIGVALARWLPSAKVGAFGLIAALVLVATVTFVTSEPDGLGTQLAPVLRHDSYVFDIPVRRTGWHLVYLGALAGVGVGLALMRHRRRLLPAIAVGLALTVAVTAATVKIRSRTLVIDVAALETPAAYDCRHEGGVTYCPFRGYAGWIPLWRGAVDPVVSALPVTARADLPTVRQIGESHVISPDRVRDIAVSSIWGRHDRWSAASRDALVSDYAVSAAGLPGRDAGALSPDADRLMCAATPARTVVALWLAAQALPHGADRVRTRRVVLPGVRYGAPEAAVVATLLARPRAEVTAALAPVWSKLTDPAGDAAVFAALGVPQAATAQPARKPADCP